MLLSASLLLGAVVVFLYFWLDSRRRAKDTGPPGPSPWPIVGNIPLLASFKTSKEAYAILAKGDFPPTIALLTRFKDIATAPYGDHWKRMRRLGLLHIGAPKQVEAWAGLRKREVLRLVDAIAAAAETERGRQGLVLRPLLFTATLNNIMMLSAGRRCKGGRGTRVRRLLPASCWYPYPVVTDAAKISEEAKWGYEFALLPSSAFKEDYLIVDKSDNKGRDIAAALEKEGQYMESVIERTLTMMSTLPLVNFFPFLAPVDPWQTLQRSKRLGGELERYFGGLIDMRRAELKEQREKQGGGKGEGGTLTNGVLPHEAGAEGKINKADSGILENQEGDANYHASMEAVRKFLKSPVVPSKTTFLDFLLSVEEEERLTGEEMYLLMFDMISGGSDTTSKTVEWALSELMRNGDVLETLRAELKEFYEGRSAVEDVAKLPYLQGVMKETLRMHPFLPSLVPRMTMEPITVGGYHLPAKTFLQINAWGIQNDPSVWKDPYKFDPTRFTAESVDVQGFDFRILPFSSGRRRCLGSYLAVDMTARLIAAIVHNFDMQLPEGVKEVDMTEVSGITAPMANPLKLVMKKRSG